MAKNSILQNLVVVLTPPYCRTVTFAEMFVTRDALRDGFTFQQAFLQDHQWRLIVACVTFRHSCGCDRCLFSFKKNRTAVWPSKNVNCWQSIINYRNLKLSDCGEGDVRRVCYKTHHESSRFWCTTQIYSYLQCVLYWDNYKRMLTFVSINNDCSVS